MYTNVDVTANAAGFLANISSAVDRALGHFAETHSDIKGLVAGVRAVMVASTAAPLVPRGELQAGQPCSESRNATEVMEQATRLID